MFGVGDGYTVVDAELGHGAVDGLLVRLIGTRRGHACVELRDQVLVAAKAGPAAVLVAVAKVDA